MKFFFNSYLNGSYFPVAVTITVDGQTFKDELAVNPEHESFDIQILKDDGSVCDFKKLIPKKSMDRKKGNFQRFP